MGEITTMTLEESNFEACSSSECQKQCLKGVEESEDKDDEKEAYNAQTKLRERYEDLKVRLPLD